MRNKKLGLIVGVMIVGLTLVAGRADAALLDFNMFLPDITSNSTGIYTYNAGTDLFTSTASPISVTFDGVTPIPVTGTTGLTGTRRYSVGFYVDAAGNFVSGIGGDDFVIKGNIDGNQDGDLLDAGDYAGDLIIGEVTNFGWLNVSGGHDQFNFTFDITGGALMPYYAPYGYKGGDSFIADGTSSFTGSFATNFSGTRVKHDTAPVPEPSSLLLLGGGLLSAALLRVRRKK